MFLCPQVQHSTLFKDGESYMALMEQENVMYSRFWMCHFLPASLVDRMLAFGDELNKLRLTRVQLYVICALQLTDPGNYVTQGQVATSPRAR